METYNIKALYGQSIFDLAQQYYGSVMYVRYIMEDNPGVDSFEYEPYAGEVFKIRLNPVVEDIETMRYYRNKGIEVNTNA